jgi:hypothetical protein
MQIEEEADLDR